jgi:hypothetical protein
MVCSSFAAVQFWTARQVWISSNTFVYLAPPRVAIVLLSADDNKRTATPC